MDSDDREINFNIRLNGIWVSLTTFICIWVIIYVVVMPIGMVYDAQKYQISFFAYMMVLFFSYLGALLFEYAYYGSARCHVQFDDSGITRYKKGNIFLFRIALNRYGGKMHYDWNEIKYVRVYRRDYSSRKISKKEGSYNFIEYPVYIACSKEPLTEEEKKKIRKEVLGPDYICFPYNKKICALLEKYTAAEIEIEDGLDNAMITQDANFDNKKKWKGTFRNLHTNFKYYE